jgi:hypothetical protein
MKTGVSEVRTASVIRLIVLIMDAVRTSETYVSFHETTLRHIPESCHQYNPAFENTCARHNVYLWIPVIFHSCNRPSGLLRSPAMLSSVLLAVVVHYLIEQQGQLF